MKVEDVLIAEFMGAKRTKKFPASLNEYFVYKDTPFSPKVDTLDVDSYFYNRKEWFAKDMLYNTSWDWLMMVVEKIGEINTKLKSGITVTTDVQIFSKSSGIIIYYDGCAELTFGNTYESKIDSVYWVVIDFIKWYNEQFLN